MSYSGNGNVQLLKELSSLLLVVRVQLFFFFSTWGSEHASITVHGKGLPDALNYVKGPVRSSRMQYRQSVLAFARVRDF